jgi:hypothetical protein
MLRWILCAALCAGACSSTTNSTHDMHVGGGGDMSGGTTPGDLAGADLAGGGGTGGTGGGGSGGSGGGGGGNGCATFLPCFNNCGQINACIESCKAKVRASSMTLLQNYIECVDESCFNQSPTICASYGDTSVLCLNCLRFGLTMIPNTPRCSTQSTACNNDP